MHPNSHFLIFRLIFETVYTPQTIGLLDWNPQDRPEGQPLDDYSRSDKERRT